MKTIRVSTLLLILLSTISSCTKQNLNSSTTSPTSEISYKNGPVSKFIKPENFVSGITNPYFLLTPGDTFYYHTIAVEDGDSIFQDVTVAVTNDIKVIQGIGCTVVHDQVTESGLVTEDTYDWYAQDIYGTVWYFGEDTKQLESDGSWNTEGSFESGIDGALAGFIMPGDVEAAMGEKYRQENYPGHAQDHAEILSTDETVTIGLGTYTHCVLTEETTPLEPGVKENKWYAPGVGEIKASIETGGDEHEELTGTN